jgi:glucose/arabinose dehydrogenase
MLKLALPHPGKAIFLFLSLLTILVTYGQPDVSYQPYIGASEGLNNPIELASAPGDASGRLFIVEKRGLIKIWNGSQLLSTPFLDITDRVFDDGGERGFLGMAFHPQYQSNGYFFVYYNSTNGNITVARYRVSSNPNVAEPDPNPSSPLISISKPYDNHNGGHLQFKPGGGTNYLYFATGDGGGGDDPQNNAQDPNSYLGKMIRINVDDPAYTPEIWARGLRNPFRWSFDRSTGDIWIGDVGQNAKEEINFRPGGTDGANYGWVCREGSSNNAGAAPNDADCDQMGPTVSPVFDYDIGGRGRSVIGGYVYRGNEFSDLRGYYIATDYFSGRVWLIKANGSDWDVIEKTGFPTGIASISEAANGALYAVDYNSNIVYKIVTPIVTPLNLISFSGMPVNGYNELKWVTESEESMDKYVVEYSTDGIHYAAAGEVLSRNSASRSVYTFQHAVPNTTTSYYRLKLLGSDGDFEYSAVITIGADTRKELKIYPTSITNGKVNIVSRQSIERIIVTNTTGVQVLSKEMNGATGYFSIDIPVLQKGVYIIRVAGRDFQKTEKLMIQ